ncbi:MAG: HD domain-containing protein [Clostridiales bacterium]|nr:HD domain-containing protein [Clostridiales bacterium]
MFRRLDGELESRIKADREKGVFFGTDESCAVRMNGERDKPSLIRPAFVRDSEKIMNLALYGRLQDKTQVLSLYHNDDISRRLLHVQFVSRIARDISAALGLNTDLTEAIALGHDIGHTPFGHAGERMLDENSVRHGGPRFCHNVHGVRALTVLNKCNLTHQTLDGILCHNGEMPMSEYRPVPFDGFDGLYRRVEDCETRGAEAITKLVPCTLEGCVVRMADIIAYVGKDRRDAATLKLFDDNLFDLSIDNAEIINNATVDIIENSYGRPYLRMSEEMFSVLDAAKRENYSVIYGSEKVRAVYDTINGMFTELFDALLIDFEKGGGKIAQNFEDSVCKYNPSYRDEIPVRKTCDFMASMTDDFFIAAYEHLLGKSSPLVYKGYFD